MRMKKSIYTTALLLAASLVFSSYRSSDDDSIAGTSIGIGSPTAVTDPGVLIGEIDGVPIRWATRNVDYPGTFAANPEDAGMFFQWNRLQGWSATGTIRGWDSSTPEGTAWYAENDPCPPGWRVPTQEQIMTLRTAGFSGWTSRNGVRGRYFGTYPNQFFLPAAGFRDGNEGILAHVGIFFGYWSSTPYIENHRAWDLVSFADGTLGTPGFWRGNGFSIRCVADDDPITDTPAGIGSPAAAAAVHDEGVVINGIRWATRNVDAPGTFAPTPESAGMIFQWNRKKGWNAIDEEVESWDYTSADTAGERWKSENDPCPKGWRIPTYQEINSLRHVRQRWTTVNGVQGRIFGRGRNTIFLPAVGHRWGYKGSLYRTGTHGIYWSSTPFDSELAWYLWFDSRNVSTHWNWLALGASIRCVAE